MPPGEKPGSGRAPQHVQRRLEEQDMPPDQLRPVTFREQGGGYEFFLMLPSPFGIPRTVSLFCKMAGYLTMVRDHLNRSMDMIRNNTIRPAEDLEEYWWAWIIAMYCSSRKVTQVMVSAGNVPEEQKIAAAAEAGKAESAVFVAVNCFYDNQNHLAPEDYTLTLGCSDRDRAVRHEINKHMMAAMRLYGRLAFKYPQQSLRDAAVDHETFMFNQLAEWVVAVEELLIAENATDAARDIQMDRWYVRCKEKITPCFIAACIRDFELSGVFADHIAALPPLSDIQVNYLLNLHVYTFNNAKESRGFRASYSVVILYGNIDYMLREKPDEKDVDQLTQFFLTECPTVVGMIDMMFFEMAVHYGYRRLHEKEPHELTEKYIHDWIPVASEAIRLGVANDDWFVDKAAQLIETIEQQLSA